MNETATDIDNVQHLRILIANERAERLEIVARVVVEMGHTVIARELDIDEVGQVTRDERPDVALVGLGETPSTRSTTSAASSASRPAP